MAASGALLFLAQKEIAIGTAYAVWTGIGAAGTFLVGMWLFGDPGQPRPLSRGRADHRRRRYTEAGPLNKIEDQAMRIRGASSSSGLWQERQRRLLPESVSALHRRKPR